MTEQELRIKALDIALETFKLFPDEQKQAAFTADGVTNKFVSQLIVETANRYIEFLSKHPEVQ
jgi:hypothetical protein